MEKFRGKYRIPTARAEWWNYAKAGDYFITIACYKFRKFLGRIQKSAEPVVMLSDIGKIVDEEWKKTFELRADMNLKAGSYVIMPNHFHAIISIGKNKYNSDPSLVQPGNGFHKQTKNLASILDNFKGAVTRRAWKINPEFEWKERYHDHIIRNPAEYQRIENYIINNPKNWKDDEFYN